MKKDTQEYLEEAQLELQKEALREEQEAGPAFEDPDALEIGPDPKVYSNFANDYNQELTQFAETGKAAAPKQEDNLLVVLMLIASILSLSIICVMFYWLQAWM